MPNSGDFALAQANEKNILLEEIDEVIEEENLSPSLVKNMVLAIAITLTLLLPKIYISSHIYLTSLKINKLLNEYYSLEAENSTLKAKIEKLKFKNRMNVF